MAAAGRSWPAGVTSILLLVTGKLIKLAGGGFSPHHQVACRRNLLPAASLGLSSRYCQEILHSATVEAAQLCCGTGVRQLAADCRSNLSGLSQSE